MWVGRKVLIASGRPDTVGPLQAIKMIWVCRTKVLVGVLNIVMPRVLR